MVYTTYKQQRILYFSSLGYKSTTIVSLLREEELTVSKSGVVRLFKYRETGSIGRRPGSGRPTITSEMLQYVEEQMQLDDESTVIQLQKLLVDKEHPLSLQTILRSRSKLGWTFRGSAYCQLIREANKVKRLEWDQKHLQTALQNEFTDVVWTTVMLECHRRFCCRKKGVQPNPKPR